VTFLTLVALLAAFFAGLSPVPIVVWMLLREQENSKHLMNELLRKNGARTFPRPQEKRPEAKDDEAEKPPDYAYNIIGSKSTNPIDKLQAEMIEKDNKANGKHQ